MEKINEIIKEYFLKNNKDNLEEEKEIFKIWKKIVDENIFKNTKIIKKQENKLYIKAKNSIYRNEISFEKNNYLKKLKINKIKLKEIIIQ